MLQHKFDTNLCIKLASGIVVAHVIREVSEAQQIAVRTEKKRRMFGIHLPLNTAEFFVTFFCKLCLHANHGLETGIEIRDAKIQHLW